MGINASTIQKLYIAYFSRPADVAGLRYWEGQLDANAISISGLAQSFSEQIEYRNTYGGKSTVEVITALYQNLFDRAPDADGLQYWATQIDTKVVNIGTAALAILNGAPAQSKDGLTIANKVNFSTQFTASLDTLAKAVSYSEQYGFTTMREILKKVTSASELPSLQPKTLLDFPASMNIVNADEMSKGTSFTLDLKNLAVNVGYSLELMLDGKSFSPPVRHVVTATDMSLMSAPIELPGNAFWGFDGIKKFGVKVNDIFGNTGEIGGQVSLLLRTLPPAKPLAVVVSAEQNGMRHIEISISAGQMNGGYIVLGPEAKPFAIDDTISATDTKLVFDVSAQNFSSLFGTYGYFVSEYDAAGNVTRFQLSDVPNTISYGVNSVLTPAKNVTFTAVGGNVMANTVNATNTGLIVTADIVPGEASGTTASLALAGMSFESRKIEATDNKVVFEINAGNPFVLKTWLAAGGIPKISLSNDKGTYATSQGGNALFASYTEGEKIEGAINPPSNLTITPLGGRITSSGPGQVVFNGTNVAFHAEATITAGQAVDGRAELWIGNKIVSLDTYIGMKDSKVTFDITSAPLVAYDPKHLQTNVPSGGKAVVKLFDRAGHVVSSTESIIVVTNYSSTSFAADHENLSQEISIVGSHSNVDISSLVLP
ncbi:DUF4214 domain-containing protein [Undibacterium sp. Di26W]|uniref:DUF4214 domain-containing protein n=1 Tax=Undibacterium sp. Di26W TaxID=3413035 RepID=UPI003BF10D0A